MSKEIAVPFRLAPDGTIAVETNPDRQIRQHVLSLVTTEPGERIMLPTYGIPLTSMLFELDDDIATAHTLKLVEQAMAIWEPGILVLSIEPLNEVHGDGLSMIKVDYRRREAGGNGVTGRSVNTAFIGINGKVIEIVRG